MKFIIADTKAEKELKLIDPKSQIEWTYDIVGSTIYDGEIDEETDLHIMTQADFNWWSDLITRYQAADNRRYEIHQNIDDDQLDSWIDSVESIDCDLEQYPDCLNDVCDQFDPNK